MTKVVFRRWGNGDVIALFPDFTNYLVNHYVCSYMHIGQHSDADYSWVVYKTRPARELEYRDLLAELQAIGYDDLRVVQRSRPKFTNIIEYDAQNNNL